MNILSGAYTFKEFDVLGGKYFIDISNMDSDTDTHVILQRLFLIGCKPVYDTFREVNLATGITSATWRVYFLTSSCPSALIVNDSVSDQVVFDNKLHPDHGENVPFQSERLPFGYRSHHGLDLGTTTCAYPSTVPESAPLPRQHQKQPAQTYAQVVQAPAVAVPTKIPQKFQLQKAVEKAKKREGQPHHGAQHNNKSAATQLVPPSSSTSNALSVSTFRGSHGTITPPGSPKARKTPPLSLTNSENDGFAAATSRKKRGRNAIDFSDMVVKQSQLPLDGIATANYFQALQTMEVRFELTDLTEDPSSGVRHQVLPLGVKRPAALQTSTESAFFVEKHHTKTKKSTTASFVPEVAEAMLNDENTALLSLVPDCIDDAKVKVGGMCKILKNAAKSRPLHKESGRVSSRLQQCTCADDGGRWVSD